MEKELELCIEQNEKTIYEIIDEIICDVVEMKRDEKTRKGIEVLIEKTKPGVIKLIVEQYNVLMEKSVKCKFDSIVCENDFHEEIKGLNKILCVKFEAISEDTNGNVILEFNGLKYHLIQSFNCQNIKVSDNNEYFVDYNYPTIILNTNSNKSTVVILAILSPDEIDEYNEDGYLNMLELIMTESLSMSVSEFINSFK